MIVRYEYANIYHTMSDFYGAFIIMQFFNRTQYDTNVIIVDGHPRGQLDTIWDTLFNSSTRVSSLKMRTRFDDAVWGIMGYVSGMLSLENDELFLIEEFRKFFLSSYDIVDDRKLDCRHISVLVIWRRDCLAHPRNPTGIVSRKIANEHELVNTNAMYHQHWVRDAQIDLFDFKQQLQLVVSADILIGMHGAGLTHTLFLAKHAALIELIHPTGRTGLTATSRLSQSGAICITYNVKTQTKPMSYGHYGTVTQTFRRTCCMIFLRKPYGKCAICLRTESQQIQVSRSVS